MPIESTCNAFYFKLAPGNGEISWFVEFYYISGSWGNYRIFKNRRSFLYEGFTIKPFTVNAAKVLLIDYLEKMNIDENTGLVKKEK